MGTYYWIVAPEPRRAIDINKSRAVCTVTSDEGAPQEVPTDEVREAVREEPYWSEEQKDKVLGWLDEWAGATVRIWFDICDEHVMHLQAGEFTVDGRFEEDATEFERSKHTIRFLRHEIGDDEPLIDLPELKGE